jgi:glycine/D-amino acid oxidase-like deaminating enzyme
MQRACFTKKRRSWIMDRSKGANARVLVIGAGVVGLTTALCLQRRGFRPIVVAEQFAPGITSNVAGALWEWPPSVCGRHHDETQLERAKAWSMTSYAQFERLAAHPESGVTLRTAVSYFKKPVVDDALERAHCVANNPSEARQDMVFIVPRGADTLLLGGLVEADEWDTDIGLHNYPPIRHILQRCAAFFPALLAAVIDPVEPVRVGLRPFRTQNARVERQAHTSIIHNYGHGGAGVTLSWGCGSDVADRVEALLGQQRARADAGSVLVAD